MPIKETKRSKFIRNLRSGEKIVTPGEVSQKWDELANMVPNKTNKAAVTLVRDDRESH